MTSLGEDYSPVRLRLDGASPRDSVDLFRDVVGPQVIGLDIGPPPGAAFFADVTVRRMAGLDVVSAVAGASVIRRTARLLADGHDGFSLAIVRKGDWRVSSRGRELDDTGGRAYLMSFADPSLAVTPAATSILTLQVPRAALAPLVGNIDDATMRLIPGDNAPLCLLRQYIGVLDTEGSLPTPELRNATVTHVHDLIALALGATRDGAAQATRRGLAAARLHAMKEDIATHLASRDLGVEFIAARHRMSSRHAQRLFGGEGVTFSGFVLEKRLARAHAMLIDSRLVGQTIAAIAFECGFGDLSHFNRAFRRRYDSTPSDVRAGSPTNA